MVKSHLMFDDKVIPLTWVNSIKQLKYPKEFRIHPPDWPDNLLSALQKSIETLDKKLQAAKQTGPDVKSTLIQGDADFYAKVGTNLWRIKQNMFEPGTNQLLGEMTKPYRHLASILDMFSSVGFTIKDYTGDEIPEAGQYYVKILASQPTPNIKRRTIIETVKPAIFYEDRMLQMGEVIVGIPESTSQ